MFPYSIEKVISVVTSVTEDCRSKEGMKVTSLWSLPYKLHDSNMRIIFYWVINPWWLYEVHFAMPIVTIWLLSSATWNQWPPSL